MKDPNKKNDIDVLGQLQEDPNMRKRGDFDSWGEDLGVTIWQEYFDIAKFNIKKMLFTIWEFVLVPVWSSLKGVVLSTSSFIGSCIHNTLMFVHDTIDSVIHFDYYFDRFLGWSWDTFWVVYYFLKPYFWDYVVPPISWFFCDVFGGANRMLSRANDEFVAYYVPPTSDSFIWWLKTYLFILVPCFLFYLWFKQDWFFTWNRQSPLTKFEKFAKMEFTRIHLWIVFILANGLTNRWELTYLGHWDEIHKHLYMYNHYSEEEYEKWCEQEIKAEIYQDRVDRWGLKLLRLNSFNNSKYKSSFHGLDSELNSDDRVECVFIWSNPYSWYNGGGISWILYESPEKDVLGSGSSYATASNHYDLQRDLYGMYALKEGLHNVAYRYFGGKYKNYHLEYFAFPNKLGEYSSLWTPATQHNFLYEKPVADVIHSEQYFLEYCYQNDIKISYHDYYWSTFLRSLEDTWVHDYAWYMWDAMHALCRQGYPEGTWWPFKQPLIDWCLRESFDGFFFLVAGSDNWTSNLLLSNSFVKAYDFCELPVYGEIANMDVFHIYV